MFVVLLPNSNTNYTNKYYVVKLKDWLKCINTGMKVTIESEWNLYEEAIKRRNDLNNNM